MTTLPFSIKLFKQLFMIGAFEGISWIRREESPHQFKGFQYVAAPNTRWFMRVYNRIVWQLVVLVVSGAWVAGWVYGVTKMVRHRLFG